MFPIHLYPYTNFHDLNLDWILNKIKELEAKLEDASVPQSVLDDIESLKTSVNTLTTTVNDLDGEVASVGSDVGILQGDISTINQKIEAIEAVLGEALFVSTARLV